MAMFPEAMKAAQKELDAVVGTHRLPDFSDRPSLPYINALIKECMRWQGIANLGKYKANIRILGGMNLFDSIGLAHSLSEDDEYEGYFIPKGTIVMGNTW